MQRLQKNKSERHLMKFSKIYSNKLKGERQPLSFFYGIVYGRFSEPKLHLEILCTTTIKLSIFDFTKSRNMPPCTARQNNFESAFSK